MSTLTQVGGIPEISAGGFLQPKQQNKWRVKFMNFGTNGGTNTIPLSMQAKKIGRPNLKFAVTNMHRYNSVAKILGKHEIGDLTITLDDDIGGTVGRAIQAQLQRQQYVIGADGPFLRASQEGSMYKFKTIVDTLNGNDVVLDTWTYEGCSISDWKGSDLDYSTSEVVTIDLTIAVDHMYQTFSDVVNGQRQAF